MKVYVIGSSKEMERAKTYIRLVELHPHMTLAKDWTASFDKAAIDGFSHDSQMPLERRQHEATEDLGAVLSCDVLWMLTPTTPSSGAWSEWGEGLAFRHVKRTLGVAGMRLICSGPGHENYIKCSLADRIFETDEAAWGWLSLAPTLGAYA